MENHGHIQQLEPRQLFAAGPQLIDVHLLGTAIACTGVVVTFNESLDPATASDVAAFSIGAPGVKSSSSDLLSTIFPFAARPKAVVISHRKVRFASADYDDATHSITLVPVAPFKAWRFFRAMRIRGAGVHALKDTLGNPFDGNDDGIGGDDKVITWVFHKGKKIAYTDEDGDKVVLTLKGKGTLFTLQRHFNGRLPMVFIEGGQAGSSVLSGRVIQGKHGDGKTVIEQISGLAAASAPIISDPSFQVLEQFP
jgi:hypothetical protein